MQSRAKTHHVAVFIGKFVKISFSECFPVIFLLHKLIDSDSNGLLGQQFVYAFVLFLHSGILLPFSFWHQMVILPI